MALKFTASSLGVAALFLAFVLSCGASATPDRSPDSGGGAVDGSLRRDAVTDDASGDGQGAADGDCVLCGQQLE